jgi:hypothetical protein
MALTIIDRNYSTRNHPSGNAFLLANSGQFIEEKITVVCEFDFTSTSNLPVTFPSIYEIQLLGGDWQTKGFAIGDTIELTGSIPWSGGVFSYSSSPYTITSINGDTITVGNSLDPLNTGVIVGTIMPSTPQGITPLQIVNATTSTPQVIEVFHNIVPNASSGSINSLIDNQVNRFEAIDVDTVSVGDAFDLIQLGYKSGGTYTNAKITRLSDVSGNKSYLITLVYNFPYKFEDSDFNEPSFFEASQSLKPYVEINAYPQQNNPNAKLQVTYGGYLGNVGWLDESYNQGANDFKIDSVLLTDSFGNPLTAIDYAQETNVSVVITVGDDFLESAEIEFYMIPVQEDIQNQPESHGDLIYLANSLVLAGGITQNIFGKALRYMNISSEVLTLTTGQIQIDFALIPNSLFTQYVESLPSEQRQYRLTATVESNGGDANNNNAVTLNLLQGILEKAPIIGGIYPDVVSVNFLDHANDSQDDAFNVCTEDDMLYQSVFELTKGIAYQKLEATIIVERDSDQAYFELINKPISFSNYVTTPNGVIQINYNEPIQQFLDNSNRNVLSLNLTGVETSEKYELVINWSLMANWRYWISQSNALVDFFDSSLPNDGLNAEWMRYLREAGYTLKVRLNLIDDVDTLYYWDARVVLQDYEGAEFVTSDILLFDVSNTEQTSLLANQMMKVVARHTLPVDYFWNVPDCWAWIGTRPNEADPNKRFSTLYDWSAQDSPLKPENGFTTAQINQISAQVIEVVCYVDTSLINVNETTFISRINQFNDKGLIQNVYKENFTLVNLPLEAISEDKGASFCDEPQLVVASLDDAAYYKNDRTGIAYKFDEMTIELEDKDGVLTLAPGVEVNFPHQPDAKGFVIDWRQVASGSLLLQGCYKVRVNWELSGNSGWFYFGAFQLLEYSIFNVQKTVRLFVVLNDLVRKQGINYKDSGFATTIRFRGQFGYMQPKYDTENIIYSDRTREKVRNEALRTFELRSSWLLNCMTRQIDEEILLCANQIYITDNNANNHVRNLYYDFPVILSDSESPSFEYTDSVFAKIKAVFLEKTASYESKYDGNIKGSDNIILTLPTLTTGSGGICENVTVHNTSFSYFQSIIAGGDLTLPDTTFNLYIDGVLVDSQTSPTLENTTIDILWQ